MTPEKKEFEEIPIENGIPNQNFDPSNNNSKNLYFTWSKLTVSVPPENDRKCCGLLSNPTASQGREILKEVSGRARPGEVLAIMGASGAGKTTLLNTFASRNSSSLEVSGDILVNGVRLSKKSLTRYSAYVQQEDLFVGSMTVKEVLIFHASLRMDRSISKEQRLLRVQEVMKELGLTGVMDTLVGVPGRIKGISGGEKKRLSFACEILTDPAILFCDEPTSGLDSYMAQSVTDMLHSLALQNKTVICTIHQPSSQVFSSFDRLLLLAEGRTAYLGDARSAKDFFSSCNFPCPEDFNPADHIVQVLAVVPGEEEESKRKIFSICNQFEESSLGKENTNLVEEEVALTKQESPDLITSPYKASWFAQLKSLSLRNTLVALKDPTVARMKIGQAFIIALILGIIYVGQDYDQKGIQNMSGALFVLITNLSFSNVFAVCNVFCVELPIFLREHLNGMYRVDTYFLAKQLVDLPLFILDPFITITILYWMVGLNSDPARFIAAVLVVLLVVQVVLSLGYLLSCLTSNVDVALAIAPIVIIPSMLFGGFFLNASSVPVWLVWLKYLSWLFYGFEALMINQWDGVEGIQCDRKGGCLEDGESVLSDRGFVESRFWVDIIILLVMIVVLRTLAFLALLRKTKVK